MGKQDEEGQTEQSSVEMEDPAPARQDSEGGQHGQDDLFAVMASLQKERDQYYDLLLRKQAEFDNYRKRSDKEKSDARLRAMRDVLLEVLGVLDVCEHGLQSMEQHGQNLESYREGYLLMQRQLRSLLSKFGVEEIEALGQPFDPNVHEAVTYEPSAEYPEGVVTAEMKKGYRLKGHLLRAAQVRVARASD